MDDETPGAGVPSSDDLSSRTSAYQRSRSARPTTHRRYHSPVKVIDLDAEPTAGERNKTETTPVPPVRRSRVKVDPEDEVDSLLSGKGNGEAKESSGPKPRRGLRQGEGISKAERASKTLSSGTLPVHRENIMTETSETNRYFGGTDAGVKTGGPKSPGVKSASGNENGKARSFSSTDDKPTGTGRKLPKTPTESTEASDADFIRRPKADTSKSNPAASSEQGSARRNSRSREEEGKERGGSGSRARKSRASETGDEKPAPQTSSSYRTTRRPDLPFANMPMPDETKPVYETPKRPKASTDHPESQRKPSETEKEKDVKYNIPRRPHTSSTSSSQEHEFKYRTPQPEPDIHDKPRAKPREPHHDRPRMTPQDSTDKPTPRDRTHHHDRAKPSDKSGDETSAQQPVPTERRSSRRTNKPQKEGVISTKPSDVVFTPPWDPDEGPPRGGPADARRNRCDRTRDEATRTASRNSLRATARDAR